MLKIVIADDEFPARQELRSLLEAGGKVKITAECEHGQAVLDYFSANTADAVFLDIKMPVLDGLTVAEKLCSLPQPPKIIFSTGFDQFAVRAFELEAFDYILKPYTQTRLQATVLKLQKTLQDQLQQQAPARSDFPIRLSLWANNKLLVFYPKEEIYLIKTDAGKKNPDLYQQRHSGIKPALKSFRRKTESLRLSAHPQKLYRQYEQST
ncbi:MAG: response regulator [Acidaminococcaceae bacterium]|nr:response regulator [Acidaminococcaceae bacterium]